MKELDNKSYIMIVLMCLILVATPFLVFELLDKDVCNVGEITNSSLGDLDKCNIECQNKCQKNYTITQISFSEGCSCRNKL